MGWLRHELIEKLGARSSTIGLKIFTSLDPIAQRAAETAVRKTLEQLDPVRKKVHLLKPRLLFRTGVKSPDCDGRWP